MQRRGAWGYMMAPVTMVTMATLLRDCGHAVSALDCPAEGTVFAAMLAAVRRMSTSTLPPPEYSKAIEVAGPPAPSRYFMERGAIYKTKGLIDKAVEDFSKVETPK